MLIVSLEIFYEDFQIHLVGTRKGDVRREFFFPPSKKKAFIKYFTGNTPVTFSYTLQNILCWWGWGEGLQFGVSAWILNSLGC